MGSCPQNGQANKTPDATAGAVAVRASQVNFVLIVNRGCASAFRLCRFRVIGFGEFSTPFFVGERRVFCVPVQQAWRRRHIEAVE